MTRELVWGVTGCTLVAGVLMGLAFSFADKVVDRFATLAIVVVVLVMFSVGAPLASVVAFVLGTALGAQYAREERKKRGSR